MDKKEGSSTNFLPDDLLKSSAFLREGKSTIRIKLYVRGTIFLSSPNFPPRTENRRH